MLLVTLGLLALLGGLIQPSRAPLAGREATTWLHAASLAQDLDRSFDERDLERFVGQWGETPRGVVVGGPDGNRFEQPLVYPLLLAPFLRLAPARGALLLNALLLTLSAWAASRGLGRRVGEAAPLVVALALFGSVAWGSLYLYQDDLVMLACGVLIMSVVVRLADRRTVRSELYEDPGRDPAWRSGLPWMVVGALLAIAVAIHPAGLALLLPIALSGARPGRRWLAVLVGFLVAGAALVGTGGVWPDLTGEEGSFDLPLAAWNVLYAAGGRHFGILPYFLPWLVLVGLASRRDRAAALLAAAVAVTFWILVSPFDFAGGAPTLGNRLFLPLFGASLLVPRRPPRLVAWAPAVVVSVAIGAGLWLEPGMPPLDAAGRYRHPTALAERWLPFELSQRTVPGATGLRQDRLRVRCLNRAVELSGDGGALVLQPGAEGEVQITAERPVERLVLEFDARAGAALDLSGGRLGQTLFHPDGGVGFEIFLDEPRTIHEMWWTAGRQHTWVLRLELPEASGGPVRFEVSSKGFSV